MHPDIEHVLKLFAYEHLPPHLQEVSKPFGELARQKPLVYCVGETTRWGGDVLMPFEANCPVIVGGVTIIPGD